jgi:hypothetical protein
MTKEAGQPFQTVRGDGLKGPDGCPGVLPGVSFMPEKPSPGFFKPD